jgi:hypothetical protein
MRTVSVWMCEARKRGCVKSRKPRFVPWCYERLLLGSLLGTESSKYWKHHALFVMWVDLGGSIVSESLLVTVAVSLFYFSLLTVHSNFKYLLFNSNTRPVSIFVLQWWTARVSYIRALLLIASVWAQSGSPEQVTSDTQVWNTLQFITVKGTSSQRHWSCA